MIEKIDHQTAPIETVVIEGHYRGYIHPDFIFAKLNEIIDAVNALTECDVVLLGNDGSNGGPPVADSLLGRVKFVPPNGT